MWDYFKIKCLFVTTQEIQWRNAFIVAAAGYNLWLSDCASLGCFFFFSFSSYFGRSSFAQKPKVGLNCIKAETRDIPFDFIFFNRIFGLFVCLSVHLTIHSLKP